MNRHYSSQRGEVYLSRFWNVLHKFGFGNFPDTFCDEVWSNTVPAGRVVRLLEVFHHHQGQWMVLGEGEGIVGNGDQASVYSVPEIRKNNQIDILIFNTYGLFPTTILLYCVRSLKTT